MNDATNVRKGFRRAGATLLALVTVSPLFVGATAHAQYIPPPASQNFTPSPSVAEPAPAAPARPQRSARPQAEEAPAETRRTRRAHRPTRAEQRAAAREAAREKAEAAREAAREKAEERRQARAKAAASAAATVASEGDEETPEIKASNAAKITLLAGEAQSTNARSAEEIAALLGAGGLTVAPQLGNVSLSQLTNPDAENPADLAILQSDALEDARRDGGPSLMRKLAFIARLYNQEIHVVGRNTLSSIADLNRRSVAVDAPDTPEGRTATRLFERANVKPRFVVMDQKSALEKLGRGEVDAAVFVGGKPVPALADLPVAGLRLLSIPYKGALQDAYYPAQIKHADYPGLVPDKPVDTVAIGTVLVALDAKPGSPRYKNLTQFTDSFFGRFGELRDPSHHPKWREINLAADVPGWRRFPPAQKWLDQAPAPRVSSVK